MTPVVRAPNGPAANLAVKVVALLALGLSVFVVCSTPN